MEDKIIITFTQELLDEWTKIYLKKHPRIKKKTTNKKQKRSKLFIMDKVKNKQSTKNTLLPFL